MSKRNICAIKQDTPAFLKRFKKQVGFKEGPSINDKRSGAPDDNHSEDCTSDPEDEQPMIVNLEETGITKEEINKFRDSEKEKEEIKATGGRIVFKKPKKIIKSEKDKESNKTKETTKDKKIEDKDDNKVKNKTLLSFNDDEDEEEY